MLDEGGGDITNFFQMWQMVGPPPDFSPAVNIIFQDEELFPFTHLNCFTVVWVEWIQSNRPRRLLNPELCLFVTGILGYIINVVRFERHGRVKIILVILKVWSVFSPRSCNASINEWCGLFWTSFVVLMTPWKEWGRLKADTWMLLLVIVVTVDIWCWLLLQQIVRRAVNIDSFARLVLKPSSWWSLSP